MLLDFVENSFDKGKNRSDIDDRIISGNKYIVNERHQSYMPLLAANVKFRRRNANKKYLCRPLSIKRLKSIFLYKKLIINYLTQVASFTLQRSD